ncbi:hypothetical protein AAG570_010681 [Ranatra chinensis]|uniref:Sex combs reduced n=1 Tax=Ranatra chinensis TaxID=642074 RepID=A0ABD0YN96_9HEMI
MSSYQFVNSLASCYQQGQQPRSPAGAADYYNANVAAYSSGGCYSPQQYAAQYVQQSPAGMMDYTQLHGAAQHQRLAAAAAAGVTHLSNATTVTNLSNSTASCKFADSTTSAGGPPGGIGSPQDLSTTSQPNRSSSPLHAKSSLASPGAATPARTPTAPAAPNPQASSTSSSSSTPANNNSGNGKASGSSSNPPQIYPWMKRVHLGQSK